MTSYLLEKKNQSKVLYELCRVLGLCHRWNGRESTNRSNTVALKSPKILMEMAYMSTSNMYVQEMLQRWRINESFEFPSYKVAEDEECEESPDPNLVRTAQAMAGSLLSWTYLCTRLSGSWVEWPFVPERVYSAKWAWKNVKFWNCTFWCIYDAFGHPLEMMSFVWCLCTIARPLPGFLTMCVPREKETSKTYMGLSLRVMFCWYISYLSSSYSICFVFFVTLIGSLVASS